MSNDEEKKLVADAARNEVLAQVEIRDEENTLCYEHYEVEPDLGAPEAPLVETLKPNVPITYARKRAEQDQERADAERAVRRYLGSKASLNADFTARVPGHRYHVDISLYAGTFYQPVRPEWHEITAEREYENVLVPAPDTGKTEPVTYRGPFALKPGERVFVARIYKADLDADPNMSQEAAADCGRLMATEVFAMKPGNSNEALCHAIRTFTHSGNGSSLVTCCRRFMPRTDGTAAVFSDEWGQPYIAFITDPDTKGCGFDLQMIDHDEDKCLEPERDYYYGPLLLDDRYIFVNVQKYSVRTRAQSKTYAFQNKLPTQYRFDARCYSAQEAVDFAAARFCDSMHIDFQKDEGWHALRERTRGRRSEAVMLYKDNGASAYRIAPMDYFGNGKLDAGEEEFSNDNRTNVLEWDVYAYRTPPTYPLGHFAPVPSADGMEVIEAPTDRAAETEARLERDPEITTRCGYIYRAVRHGSPAPDTPKTPDALIDWGYFSN